MIFRDDKHGVVLIHGDAPPLFLGALMAKRQGLKVAQVEAGLRSFNYFKPFPEEITRVFSAKAGLIDIFFCQNEKATLNVAPYKKTAFCTHYNTMLDSLRLAKKVSLKKKNRRSLRRVCHCQSASIRNNFQKRKTGTSRQRINKNFQANKNSFYTSPPHPSCS